VGPLVMDSLQRDFILYLLVRNKKAHWTNTAIHGGQ